MHRSAPVREMEERLESALREAVVQEAAALGCGQAGAELCAAVALLWARESAAKGGRPWVPEGALRGFRERFPDTPLADEPPDMHTDGAVPYKKWQNLIMQNDLFKHAFGKPRWKYLVKEAETSFPLWDAVRRSSCSRPPPSLLSALRGDRPVPEQRTALWNAAKDAPAGDVIDAFAACRKLGLCFPLEAWIWDGDAVADSTWDRCFSLANNLKERMQKVLGREEEEKEKMHDIAKCVFEALCLLSNLPWLVPGMWTRFDSDTTRFFAFHLPSFSARLWCPSSPSYYIGDLRWALTHRADEMRTRAAFLLRCSLPPQKHLRLFHEMRIHPVQAELLERSITIAREDDTVEARLQHAVLGGRAVRNEIVLLVQILNQWRALVNVERMTLCPGVVARLAARSLVDGEVCPLTTRVRELVLCTPFENRSFVFACGHGKNTARNLCKTFCDKLPSVIACARALFPSLESVICSGKSPCACEAEVVSEDIHSHALRNMGSAGGLKRLHLPVKERWTMAEGGSAAMQKWLFGDDGASHDWVELKLAEEFPTEVPPRIMALSSLGRFEALRRLSLHRNDICSVQLVSFLKFHAPNVQYLHTPVPDEELAEEFESATPSLRALSLSWNGQFGALDKFLRRARHEKVEWLSMDGWASSAEWCVSLLDRFPALLSLVARAGARGSVDYSHTERYLFNVRGRTVAIRNHEKDLPPPC